MSMWNYFRLRGKGNFLTERSM